MLLFDEPIDGLDLDGVRWIREVGDLAHSCHIPLHHLSEVEQSLEDADLELTGGSASHHGGIAEPARATAERAR